MFGLERIQELLDFKNSIVECEECGCLLYRKTAQVVENRVETFRTSYINKTYYCRLHKKSYDVIEFGDKYKMVDAHLEPIKSKKRKYTKRKK